MLNLTKMFEAQRAIVAHIIREKGLEGQDLLPNTILALQVEFGELANEWRGFKHWSNDREPRNSDVCPGCQGRGFWFSGERVWCDRCNRTGKVPSPMLVEYVDCLSFILSLGLLNGFEGLVLKESYWDTQRSTTEIFLHLFADAIYLGGSMDIKNYELFFVGFLELGHQLGFTWEQIEQAYYAKNKINQQRQESGY